MPKLPSCWSRMCCSRSLIWCRYSLTFSFLSFFAENPIYFRGNFSLSILFLYHYNDPFLAKNKNVCMLNKSAKVRKGVPRAHNFSMSSVTFYLIWNIFTRPQKYLGMHSESRGQYKLWTLAQWTQATFRVLTSRQRVSCNVINTRVHALGPYRSI